MPLSERKWELELAVVVMLVLATLLGGRSADSTVVKLDAVDFWIFPPAGQAPANVKFLISIRLPWQPSKPNQTPRLGPGSGIRLSLVEDGGRVVELKVSQGPAGLSEAVPASPLKSGELYRLRIDGDSENTRRLAMQVESAAWRILPDPDITAPVWSASPTLEAARLATTDCFDFSDCENIRELDFMVPVTDDSGVVVLLWSDAPLDGSAPPRYRHQTIRGATPLRTLCCFSADDHLVRFEARDAAGNTAEPAPAALAFGD